MSLGGILGALFTDLGRKADAASATGSANAKLAMLLRGLGAATYSAYSVVASDEASGTITIDSGQLAAGDYEVIAYQTREQASGSSYRLQHRNAANSANIVYAALAGINIYGATFVWWPRKTFALNERVRIANENIGGAGSFVTVGLFIRLIA